MMTRLVVIIAALLLGCVDERPTPAPATVPAQAPAEPKYYTIADVPKFLSRLRYVGFQISGAAFLENRLFVTTNIGLFEVQGHEVKQIYEWYDDAVIEGPWSDEPRAAIWIQRLHDGYFVRLDHKGWRLIAPPKPPKGYYTRGNVLEGFTSFSDASHFYLITAGYIWKWDDSGKWLIEPSPPSREVGNVVAGSAPIDNLRLYITTKDSLHCLTFPCNYVAYWHDAGQWSAPLPFSSRYIREKVVSTSNEVFVCDLNGKLLQVKTRLITSVDTPGPCKSITRTSDGKLLASFNDAGIFILKKNWVKLFDDPDPQPSGEYSGIHLAESRGVVAFVSGERLWVSEGKKLVSVELCTDPANFVQCLTHGEYK